MADKTAIEWTDATWNPIVGCSIVSTGCTNCYAMQLAGTRLAHIPRYAGLTSDSKAGPVWNGSVRLVEDALMQPLRWRRPRRIFVNSMSDLFHESVPDEWIDRIFAVMALAPQHTFQVLTKRAERMRRYFSDGLRSSRVTAQFGEHDYDWTKYRWPLPNVWLGVSAEDQTRANERIPLLLDTPAAVRFVSAEPLLGPIYFRNFRIAAEPHGQTHDALTGYSSDTPFGYVKSGLRYPFSRGKLDWVIVGGESGPGARPMHPDWARTIRDQCAATGVPFLFKQWGEFREFDTGSPDVERLDDDSDAADAAFDSAVNPSFIAVDSRHIRNRSDLPDDGTPCRLIERLGKKAAGRLLDGVEHNGYPEASHG